MTSTIESGRGSQKKSKVFVMAESTPIEGKITRGGKPRKVNHITLSKIILTLLNFFQNTTWLNTRAILFQSIFIDCF
jgi:hypothetical protein